MSSFVSANQSSCVVKAEMNKIEFFILEALPVANESLPSLSFVASISRLTKLYNKQ